MLYRRWNYNWVGGILKFLMKIDENNLVYCSLNLRCINKYIKGRNEYFIIHYLYCA